MEFRKSRPRESAMKNAGGLWCTIGPQKAGTKFQSITGQIVFDKLRELS
jgi:hypothetical protein